MKEVYIVSAVRTAFGSFGGTLAGVTATRLGAAAIKGALDKIKIDSHYNKPTNYTEKKIMLIK